MRPKGTAKVESCVSVARQVHIETHIFPRGGSTTDLCDLTVEMARRVQRVLSCLWGVRPRPLRPTDHPLHTEG